MNQNDLRVKKTKRLFQNTLKELMLKYDNYYDITIKELCETAEINRRTFYLHYQTIDDILLEIQEEFALHYYEETKKYDHISNVKETMLIFFQMTNNNPIYERIVLSPAQDYLRETIKAKTVDYLYQNNNLQKIASLDNRIKNLIETFYHLTTIACYREWFTDKKRIPLEKMAEIASNLVSKGVGSIINS